MALIVWSDKLSLGIDVLDEDHKELIGLLNDVHDIVLNRTSEANLRAQVDRLLRFATIHFALEEELASNAGFTLPSAHRRAHHEFAKWMTYTSVTKRDQLQEPHSHSSTS